jgi:catechol 2,3-dioxygenase-like lactoylglutathione lyase family enzyme
MNVMSKKSEVQGRSAPAVRGYHHYAYKCKDPAATRAFYEDLLGLPLTHVVEEHDVKTTTGDVVSFAHFFFELSDGSMIAFFDLGDGRASQADPETPAFVNHLALSVDGEDELLDMKQRLEGAGHDVVGPMDHDDFVRSIYFWDPNGIRMEFAYSIETPDQKARAAAEAHQMFERWRTETSPAVKK